MPKKRTAYNIIVPLLIILTSILFFIGMIKSKPDPIQKDAAERAWSVDSIIVNKANHRPILQLYGQVISSRDIQLTSSIEADVTQRHVNLGDTVKIGQILLSLDATRLTQVHLQKEAELNEATARLNNEQHQFETNKALLKHEQALLKITNNALKRAKTLEKSLMASNSQLDDAKRAQIQQKIAITRLEAKIANYPNIQKQWQAKQKQAQTRRLLAKDDLLKTQLLSPVNGVVTAVSVDDGEHVRKGTALFSISDTENIEIRSLIPQTQYNVLNKAAHVIQQNQSQVKVKTEIKVKAKIKQDVSSDTPALTATLDRLPPNINAGQAGSFAFFHLDKNINGLSSSLADASLLIGQTVTVFVELNEQKNSLALPHDAIYGTDTVFIVKDEHLKRIKVEWLGEIFIHNKKHILIRSNELKNNDEILISKFANAMQGLKVKSKLDKNIQHNSLNDQEQR